MADDWDLYAVVRSCKIAVAGTATTSATSINNSKSSSIGKDDSFPSLESLTFQNDDDNSFLIPGLLDDKNHSFKGLEEIYGEFCAKPIPTTTTTATSTTSITVGEGFQNQRRPQQAPPIQQQQQQLQQVVRGGQNLEFENVRFDPSNITFPSANPQPIRPRKRKNQQSKMVRQMTQEELSADSWAWRKYGQKPIKGSPYPRNYYRCSTSKGCAARKQVERSPTEPNIYIVSYTGEHTHPRPTHRSSLAGSTRTKFSTANKPSSSDPTATATPNNIASIAPICTRPSCSTSSPASGSSFSPSPNTPLMEGEHIQDNDTEMLKADDDDILIPNEFVSEDIFKGFQEINAGTNGSDHNSSGAAVGDDYLLCNMLSSPWSPSSSAATIAKFTGGGGG